MEEFKDENNPVTQENQEPEETLVIRKEDQPGYDPDDDLTFEISPVAAAFIGLVGTFVLYQIIGGLLTILIFGMDLENVPVNQMRLMTMGGQILFILLPALVFTKWIYSDIGKIIRIRKPELNELALFTLGIIILTPLLQSYVYIQNHFIELWAKNSSFINSLKSTFDSLNEMVDKTYTKLLAANNVFELFFIVIIVAIVPALSEETLFRGFIQRSFELKLKKYLGAFITAVFFSAYHFNPYGFIPLFVLGFFFGYASFKSRTLLVPMFLHFFNNFSAVMLYHIGGDDELLKSDVSASSHELQSYVILFLGLCLIFAGLIFYINRYYSIKSRKEL